MVHTTSSSEYKALTCLSSESALQLLIELNKSRDNGKKFIDYLPIYKEKTINKVS